MSNQIFSPEFKDEAVKQVPERGHPVAEVAARFGTDRGPLERLRASVGEYVTPFEPVAAEDWEALNPRDSKVHSVYF